MSAIANVAGLEFRIAFRNRWIVTAISIMTLLSLILVFAGSAASGTTSAGPLTVAASSLATLCVYLVPLLALLLSYDAIGGEVDRGTLPLVMTCPVRRWQIIAGKFVAQAIVVVIAVGIGIGSAVVAIAVGGGDISTGLGDIFRLQWTAVLLGLVFLAVGNLISVTARQPAAAASLAVGVWIVVVVMVDVALLGAVVADDGGVFTKTVFPWLLAFSPTDAFRLFNLLAIEAQMESNLAVAPLTLGLPAFAPIATLIGWLVVLLAATVAVFRRIEP